MSVTVGGNEMDLTFMKECYVKGRGTVLVFQKETDESKLPKVGEVIDVEGKFYRVRGLEYGRDLVAYSGKIITPIGVVVTPLEGA